MGMNCGPGKYAISWNRIPARVLRAASTRVTRRRKVRGIAYMGLDPCAYCGGPGTDWDHIEPLARGGAHSAENITRACSGCNATKRDKPLLLFLATRAA